MSSALAEEHPEDIEHRADLARQLMALRARYKLTLRAAAVLLDQYFKTVALAEQLGQGGNPVYSTIEPLATLYAVRVHPRAYGLPYFPPTNAMRGLQLAADRYINLGNEAAALDARRRYINRHLMNTRLGLGLTRPIVAARLGIDTRALANMETDEADDTRIATHQRHTRALGGVLLVTFEPATVTTSISYPRWAQPYLTDTHRAAYAEKAHDMHGTTHGDALAVGPDGTEYVTIDHIRARMPGITGPRVRGWVDNGHLSPVTRREYALAAGLGAIDDDAKAMAPGNRNIYRWPDVLAAEAHVAGTAAGRPPLHQLPAPEAPWP